MSLQVIRVYNLRCDRCGEYGTDHVPAHYTSNKARQVRRYEAADGWTRVGADDLCPRCSGTNQEWRP